MNTLNNKTLAELQSALQDFLLDKTVDTNELTLETPAFSRQERLHIYHSAYRLRLIDALGNDYPALESYLGEDEFVKLASEFIEQYPSQNPSLRWLGEKLPEFLSRHAHWQTNIHLVELAEFEWAQAMAFDAADELITTLDDIRSLPPMVWMTMQLRFHPSLQLLHFFSNAPEQWTALIKDEIAIGIKTEEKSHAWLIWRENLQVVYRPLEESEAWALNRFLTSNNFSDVCNGLCEWFAEENVPLQTAQYLQRWIQSGLIVEVITSALPD